MTPSLTLTDQEIAESHNERITELQYRLSWARTYLKAYGLLDNSARGVWVLIPRGKEIDIVDPRLVTHFVQELKRSQKGKLTGKNKSSTPNVDGVEVAKAEAILQETWREELLARLLVSVLPEFFDEI